MRSTCVLYRRIQYDRTHTYDIYSVSNHTKTNKHPPRDEGFGTLAKTLGAFLGFILPGKIRGHPKTGDLVRRLPRPYQNGSHSFFDEMSRKILPQLAINDVITFVHGLKQWLSLGLLVSPWFFGALKHCSMGASGLYHCGIVGSRDAWPGRSEGRP